MKFFFLLFYIFLLSCGNKPKTVLICGDHVCVNKDEAEQYFEENLSIEIKIVDKKIEKQIDLVELNLKENNKGDRVVSIFSKDKKIQDPQILSDDEISKIKNSIKKKKKEKKFSKKSTKIIKDVEKKEELKIYKSKPKNINISKNNVNKNRKDIVDVCTILEKCSIEEISKLLLEQGRNKKFPDITIRQ